MRYVEVGGLRLSAIGLGTWQFGSREWGYGAGYASDTAPAIVRRAIELGVTLIDTAEMYGFGRSERIVGEAIRAQREGLVIATKLVPVLPLPSVVSWQVRGSLRRLGLEAIDLYQVHFPNPLVSPRSTMAPLRTILEQGLVRHVGVSNHSLGRWRAAERGLGHPVLTDQVRFSLAAPLPHWRGCALRGGRPALRRHRVQPLRIARLSSFPLSGPVSQGPVHTRTMATWCGAARGS